MRMHPISYNGQALAPDEFAYRAPAGSGGFNPAGITEITFPCPGNAKRRCLLAITLGPHGHDERSIPRWHWDGNMEAPTLSPSIGCDRRCGWHGHIIAGNAIPEGGVRE